MRALLTILLLTFLHQAIAQPCDTSALEVIQVRASDTDSNIPFELPKHYTFYNPNCTARNLLLVHLVGTFGNPGSSVMFPSVAAINGFHVLSLKYENDLSAQTSCGGSSDVDCHLKFRREIIEGVDYSTEIAVDSSNSIENRLIKLLQYMDANYPANNWGQYFIGDSVIWNKVMVSGHSQGGGHAAAMAIDRQLNRVLMFASPNDYSNFYSQYVPWTALPHLTPDSAYYSFNNTNDLVAQYDWQYHSALDLGEASFGDTVNVDLVGCPYNNSHNLYTARDSTGFTTNHGMVVTDDNTPLDANGVSQFISVWHYMLGIECASSGLPELLPHTPKTLVAIYDLLGRETTIQPNVVLIYKYSDGSTKKVMHLHP